MRHGSMDRCRPALVFLLASVIFVGNNPVGEAADEPGSHALAAAGSDNLSAPPAASTPLPRPQAPSAHEPSLPLPTARSALPALGSLLVVLGAFWFGLHAMARRRHAGAHGSPAALDCLGQWQIGKHCLYLVRVGSRLLVLSGAHDALCCLAEISDPAEVERLLQSCETGGDALPPLMARFAQPGPAHWLAGR